MAKECNKSDLQSLPECARDFIKFIIKKMRYRKKVRADVQAELAAHFEDELRDCKTDEEKQQKAQRLIEDFGDAKLLGILLRRAKKRCRPLWRTAVVRGFQATGVLILCLIFYTVWFLSGRPVVTVDYLPQLNSMVQPTSDDNLNAAMLYIEAAKQSEKSLKQMYQTLGKRYHEVTQEEKQAIREWLETNKATIDLFIAGTKRPYYWRRYETSSEDSGLLGVLLPNLSNYRRLVYALRWRALLSAEQGRYEDAFSDIKSIWSFSHHLRGNRTLVEQLVGIAISAVAVSAVLDILSDYQVDSDTLTVLQHDLKELIEREDFAVSYKLEKLLIYDEIQRSFTEDRLGGGHLYIPRVSSLGYAPGEAEEKSSIDRAMRNVDFEAIKKGLHALFTHPNKQQTRETTDRLYDFFDKFANRTPAELRVESIDLEAQAMEIVKGNLLLEIMTPAAWRLNELVNRHKAGTHATLAIIAIFRYAQDKGHCPDNLDELIAADYLKELPMDPYSNKPLVYRKVEDHFILYSIGRNFIDDGGKVVPPEKDECGRRRWSDEGDWVFWPVQK
jgi:hypothetical protein